MNLLRNMSKLALAASATALMAGAAHAGGTDAGTSVENTFTLDYDVDGTPQGTITNDPTYSPGAGDPSPVVDPAGPTDFTVDRLIDLTVTANNSGLLVPPNAEDRILEFTLTNTGNDNQAYSLSIDDVTGDDFDATGLEITYSRAAVDLNNDGDTSDSCEAAVSDAPLSETTVGAGAGSADVTCDIPKDGTATINISGDIPDSLTEAEVDDLIVVAETRNPTVWATEGTPATPAAVTAEDGDATNTIDGVAENVFADDSGSSSEVANDGLHSAPSSYVISSPDLTAEKDVWVLATASDETSCASETVPGSEPTGEYSSPTACVLYTITATNTGEEAGSDATGIEIVDELPADVAFVKAETSGFDAVPTLTYKKADGTTDCDGAAGETCTVTVSGADLSATTGATDSVAYLRIWALVR